MNLHGNIPVIPTPFVNGKLDEKSFVNMIERTYHALDGYVVCGSTGEAPALTTQERKAVTSIAAAQGLKEKCWVVGLGHTSLEEAVEIGSHAKEMGINTALVPSPYYFPNSLDMVIDYVGSLAERTELEIVFYDNPVTTKTYFSFDDLQKLIRAVPSVKAIKMTDHNMDKIRKLKADTSVKVFCGDDIICFRSFEAGVDGNMIITPIVYPDAFKACWDAYRSGDRKRSFEFYCRHLLPFIHMFGPGDEIPVTKALFHHLGIFASAETRPPLQPSSPSRLAEAILGYEQGLL